MTGVAKEYLAVVRAQMAEVRAVAEKAMEQVKDEDLYWSPDPESNSIAVIIKHMSGNMLSRWTDFFETDGEKPDRDRDEEFSEEAPSREALLERWNSGWAVFEGALASIGEEDLMRTVYIRQQPHSVIQAVERQVYHYSYHVGQIVYIAKQLRSTDWSTLTIPRRPAGSA